MPISLISIPAQSQSKNPQSQAPQTKATKSRERASLENQPLLTGTHEITGVSVPTPSLTSFPASSQIGLDDAYGTSLPDSLPSAKQKLSEQGKTVYTLHLDDENFPVGQVVHTWETKGNAYKITRVIHTTGIARAVNRNTYISSSEGVLTAHGFRPERYTYQERSSSRQSTFTANFDWQARFVTTTDFRGTVRQYPLEDNAHDWISSTYQLAALEPKSENVEFYIAHLGKLDKTIFENLGEENIEIPGGVLKTIHLRKKIAAGDFRREVWLAPDLQFFPVKILWSDKDYVYVQILTGHNGLDCVEKSCIKPD